MTCDDILRETEKIGEYENGLIAERIISEFLELIDEKIEFENSDDHPVTKLINLEKKFVYKSEYIELFFELLAKYGYNTKQEIIGAISSLGNLSNPANNSRTIRNLLNSPFIDDISYDGKGLFRITSNRYGITSVNLASHHFRKNDSIRNYVLNNPLPNRCHNHTLFLRAVMPAYTAVTSLCSSYFKGQYYHSYSIDENGEFVIDLCSNAVIDKETYDFIFETEEISKILNSDITTELKITGKNTNQPVERFALLKIALYKQLLTMEARKENPDSVPILSLTKKTPH